VAGSFPHFVGSHMSNVDAISRPHAAHATSPLSRHKSSPWFNVLAGVVVVAGVIYAGYHLASDLSVVRDTRVFPFILLGIALMIALGFEFVTDFTIPPTRLPR